MSIAETAWVSDPARQSELVSQAEALLANETLHGREAAALLIVLGRLARMQAQAELDHLRPMIRDPGALVAEALSGFDFLALEGAAMDFGISAPDLSAEAEVAEPARAQVLQALAVRDEVDQLLTGAQALSGQAPALSDEATIALQEFDGVVEPILFRAMPVNQARQAALAHVAPELRARLWWYARGCTLEPTSLQLLARTAEMLHTFPEAGRELETLQRVERGMAHLFRPRQAERAQAGAVMQAERLGDQEEDQRQREKQTLERTGPGRGRSR